MRERERERKPKKSTGYPIQVENSGINTQSHSVLKRLAGSWILASRHPHMGTSGRITHSKFCYTSSKHKSLNHKSV